MNALHENYKSDDLWLLNMQPSVALNPVSKRTKSFMHVFIVIRVHDPCKSEFQQGHVEGDQFRHSQHA